MSEPYASRTKVPVDKSHADIKKMLRDLGADRIAMYQSTEENFLVFEVPRGDGYATAYKISQPIPAEGRGSPEQRERSAWRALVLLIKAKKVAIEQGITTIEKEFMGDVVMPGGTTLIEHLPELVAHNYSDGPPQIGWTP